MAPQAADDTPARILDEQRQRAQALVDAVLGRASPGDDEREVDAPPADTVAEFDDTDPADQYARARIVLADAARFELVQLLSTLEAQVDMLDRHDTQRGRDAEGVRQSIHKMAAIVRVLLDPAETQRLLVRTDPQAVDLGRQVETYLAGAGLLDGRFAIETRLEPAVAFVDAPLLIGVVEHMLGQLQAFGAKRSSLVVRLRSQTAGPDSRDAHLHLFVGARDAPFGPERIAATLTAPLNVAAVGFDIPYARAIAERHDGRLAAWVEDDGPIGWRITLPRGNLPEPTGLHEEAQSARHRTDAARPPP